jgi:predicted Zn-dependent peptidase
LYQQTTLTNGVRVTTEYIPYVRSVTIGFWFLTGSRDEAAGNNGISHFIEHMLFKGTARRSARQIAEVIDAAGGQLNAFTSKEHTCYYVRVLDEHLQLAVQILAEMVLESEFNLTELDKEKSVIVEEIRMYEDSPDELVHDLFADAVLANHPLGKGILGSEATVMSLDRAALLSHKAKYYTAGSLVVAAAGNVRHEQVVAAVSESLGGLQGSGAPQPLSATPSRGNDVIRTKDTEQVHLCIGGLGLGRHSERKYGLYVLDMALGGGMSSRLFQELREERGLVYATYSYHTLFRDTGLFTIYAGCRPKNVGQVIALVHEQCAGLTEQGLDAQELHRAKEQLKGSLMLSLESTANRMSRLAKAELFEEGILTADELMARIEAVTAEEVHAVAQEVLRWDEQIIAAIGAVTPTQVALR